MQLSRKFVIALWDAMVGETEIGVIGEGDSAELISTPKARECVALILSVFEQRPPAEWELRHELNGQAEGSSQRKTEQVRAFFQACADALAPAEVRS